MENELSIALIVSLGIGIILAAELSGIKAHLKRIADALERERKP